MRVLFQVSAVLAVVFATGIGLRESLHATQTPAADSPGAQADGCGCGNCQCGAAQAAELERLMGVYAAHHDAIEAFNVYFDRSIPEKIIAWEAADCPISPEFDPDITETLQRYESEYEFGGRPSPVSVLPTPISTVPERTADEVMQGLQEAFPLDASEQEADAQPTPYEVIFKAIDLLDLENTETLMDFGCGSDARVLTHAFHDTGCRGIGIEIDPDRAASARNLVRTTGLSPWIEIVEGDAVTTPVEGNVGFVYLWPETLEELRPKLQELDRFVSYAHEVPGLDMQRIDVPGYEPLWYWERSPEVSYAERPYAVYNGRRYYADYNPSCNCSMCRTIRSQLASQENVERIPTQSTTQSATVEPRITAPVATPQVTTTVQRSTSGCSNCSGGNCGRPMFGRRGRR